MGEKRRSRRYPRRLRVRFGELDSQGFPHAGLTNDVSAAGLFIVSSHTPRPGSRIHLEVSLQSGGFLYLECMVTRQTVVPPELRQVMKSGFGARYLVGNEMVAELVPALSTPRRDDPFCLNFPDVTTWHAALDKDLMKGGAFVWSAKPVAVNTNVTLTVDLKFVDRQLVFDARVVHVMQGVDGRHGVALVFVDPTAAQATLTANRNP